MNPREKYHALPDKTKQVLDDYSLKGYILKQVTTDIEEHLDGVTDALLGEVHDDESVTVYQLHLGSEQDTISPFLKWKNHKVEEVTTQQGRKPSVEYVMSRDKGQGLFVDKNARVFVPMRA